MFSLQFLLLINLTLTAFLTGLIWFVQVVHYPIFLRVRPENFTAFHQAHTGLTSQVVILPMLLELGFAFALAFKENTGIMAWFAFALVGIPWASTFFLSVPLHNALHTTGYDPSLIQRLVNTNWIRCWAWTLRTGLLCWMLWQLKA